MKKAFENETVVAALPGFDKFKYGLNTMIDEDLRGAVVCDMKGMLGNPQAVAVRVRAD